LSLIGPLAMYVFLRFLTGVPHAERSSLASRGEAYRNYQQTLQWLVQVSLNL
jgi:steroid 5-alpha reductase family enzyme